MTPIIVWAQPINKALLALPLGFVGPTVQVDIIRHVKEPKQQSLAVLVHCYVG